MVLIKINAANVRVISSFFTFLCPEATNISVPRLIYDTHQSCNLNGIMLSHRHDSLLERIPALKVDAIPS